MKLFTKILSFGLLLSPVLVSANVNFGWATSLVDAISGIVNSLIPIAIAIGLLFFIWGLVQFIAASGDDNAKQEGKNKMIWGVVALFVIISVWGIIAIMRTLFGIGGESVPTVIPGV
jgi:hypothetical protein